MTITKDAKPDAKPDAAGAATDTDHELLRQPEAQVRRAPIVLLNDGVEDRDKRIEAELADSPPGDLSDTAAAASPTPPAA
jgi:hypothetical protein